MTIHSSVLAWRIPGMGESGGLLSVGSHRVRHDWNDLAAAAAYRKKRYNHWEDSASVYYRKLYWWDHRFLHIFGEESRSTSGNHGGSVGSTGLVMWIVLTIFWQNIIQFSSVAQSCPTLCDPMNCSMPGLPVHHQLLEFTQTHVHRVSNAIQPSHPLSSPSPPAPNPSQHQIFFPVVMYGCESWTVKKAECQRIDAFELWCWRILLRVPWTARRSNQSILKEISSGCSLEGMMLKLKLQYFGHLMRRVDSLEKTLMLGGIGGRRRRERQRMRWLDGITDLMEVSLSEL